MKSVISVSYKCFISYIIPSMKKKKLCVSRLNVCFYVCRIHSEEQTLANLMREERWSEALLLTLKLDQPFNALKVIHHKI